ncbi:MAG: histidine kinase [Bacteroides sp.]|nr:histidine kinase [Bacteroides sp.]
MRFRRSEIFLHLLCWAVVLTFPFIMMTRSGFEVSLTQYLRHGSIVPLSFFFVFYINYFVLIPRYLFGRQTKKFLLLNVLLIVLVAGFNYELQIMNDELTKPIQNSKFIIQNSPPPPRPPRLIFFFRDLFTMVLTVGLSVAIRLSSRWSQIENARREAERARTEAELTNLRSQLNPHFLLNTLNNIYALIAFDADKAQTAVQELSRLLRHVLYDNRQATVPIEKEMDFMRNYIELMRIRLAPNVQVETQFDIPSGSRTQIAPLIFISLIENAFKHGISPTRPSYIHIRFSESQGSVECDIRNSYHPKSTSDKSGSGIGLEQVRKRLELTYPGRYEWKHGVSEDGKEYYSVLKTQQSPKTLPQPLPREGSGCAVKANHKS